jgi:hypothetical protein
MRRTVELLLIVLTTGLVVSSAAVLPAYASDFTLAVSPTHMTLQIGSSVRFTITLTSQGLQGTINVGIKNISPSLGKGITFTQPRYDVWISRTAPVGTAILVFGAAPGAAATTYTITITGKDITGGCCYGLSHSAIVTLTVA